MVAHDPDEDARRLSREALRQGDATGWFERLYAEAADGQAIVPWDRGAPNRRSPAPHPTACRREYPQAV